MIPICPETAVSLSECVLTDMTGVYLVGAPMAYSDLNLLLSACLAVIALSWGFRQVANHIRGRG